MSRKGWFKIVLSLPLLWTLAAGAFFPDPSQAASGEGLLFILDCSGSMWGRVEGKAKISTAKEVLQKLLRETPREYRLALMAYGHRRKGDCDDLEMIAPPGTAGDEIASSVGRLNPKGKTPISGALLKAGELLASREEPTTVVLVSDGLETCGGDPCQVAKDLKEKGIRLVVHVVGFDVDQAAADQLRCIAEGGGGRFFRADNVDQLQEALSLVKATVVESKPLPPPPKTASLPEARSRSKRLRIAGPGEVVLKPASWVKPPRYWALLDVETGEEAARSSEESLRVRAGEYQLLWRQTEHEHQPAQLSQVVKVQGGETVEAPVDTGLRLGVPEGVEAPHRWGLLEEGETEPLWSCRGTLEPQVVPAGVYGLYWHQVDHESRPVVLGEVRIEPGKLNDVAVDSGVALQPAPWIEKDPYYWALKDGEGDLLGMWQSLQPQLAPPGDYTLVYRSTQHHNNEVLWGEVTVPEHGFAEVPLNSGLIFLHDPDAKAPYGVFLVNLDTGAEISAQYTWDPLVAPPGRYRLDWWENQHESKRITLADEVVLEPGTAVELEM